MPTELGNVIRAFETHPRERYSLEGIAIWPRVAAVLGQAEGPELDEVTTDLAFWLNGLFIVEVFGSLFFAERLWHRPGDAIVTAAIEIAVVASIAALGTFMYRQLVAAAMRWGEPVRAAFDVHRLEVYDRLGVLRPVTAQEDRQIGEAVNRMLAFGEPLPDEFVSCEHLLRRWTRTPQMTSGRVMLRANRSSPRVLCSHRWRAVSDPWLAHARFSRASRSASSRRPPGGVGPVGA